jgi:hypothetical protein
MSHQHKCIYVYTYIICYGMQECRDCHNEECRNAIMPECRNVVMPLCRKAGMPECWNAIMTGIPECGMSKYCNVKICYYFKFLPPPPHYNSTVHPTPPIMLDPLLSIHPHYNIVPPPH